MAVHAIRVTASVTRPSGAGGGPRTDEERRAEIAAALDRAAPAADRVRDDRRVEPALAHTKEDERGERMVRATFRVDGDRVGKAAILDRIEARLSAASRWYRIEHHDCDLGLPPDERTGCPAWSLERSGGPVPSDSEMWR